MTQISPSIAGFRRAGSISFAFAGALLVGARSSPAPTRSRSATRPRSQAPSRKAMSASDAAPADEDSAAAGSAAPPGRQFRQPRGARHHRHRYRQHLSLFRARRRPRHALRRRCRPPGLHLGRRADHHRKAEWPDWFPPSEMIARQPYLPRFVAGGPGNPLGARAMYLGSSEYRIHGTNDPTTIGKFVSSGCIRLTNEDVSDLFSRVDVGTRVVVLPKNAPLRARGPAQARPRRDDAAVAPSGHEHFGLGRQLRREIAEVVMRRRWANSGRRSAPSWRCRPVVSGASRRFLLQPVRWVRHASGRSAANGDPVRR